MHIVAYYCPYVSFVVEIFRALLSAAPASSARERTVSFCSGVPMLTRMAFGAPHGASERTITPFSLHAFAKSSWRLHLPLK